jgi:hypothetical protein
MQKLNFNYAALVRGVNLDVQISFTYIMYIV